MTLKKALAFLEQPDTTMKMIGLKMLKELENKDEAFEHVKKLLQDSSPDVRSYAAEILSLMSSCNPFSIIADLLRDPDPNVRIIVLKIFEKNPNSEFVDVIKPSTRDTDDKVKRAALRALAAIGTSEILDAVLFGLKSDNSIIFDEATKILANYKGEVPASIVEVFLDDSDPNVKAGVIQYLLPKLKSFKLDYYLKALSDSHPDVCTTALKQLQSVPNLPDLVQDSESLVSKLVERLDDPVKSVRLNTLLVLGILKPSSALERLIEVARNDSDEDIRALATDVIVNIRRAMRS